MSTGTVKRTASQVATEGGDLVSSPVGAPLSRLTVDRPSPVPPTQTLERQGLYELMRAGGVVLHAAAQTIGARTATATEARLLHETRGAPLLTMERTVYDGHADAVEYGSHLYRASRYCFEQ